MDYVLGFVFDQYKASVLLIRKNRPSWQAGKLNGIGGKIEEGETPLQAMAREAREETNLTDLNWRHYATLKFNGSEQVYVFEAIANPWAASAMTDENLSIVLTEELVTGFPAAMSNLPWLVAMSYDPGFASILTVDYGENNG